MPNPPIIAIGDAETVESLAAFGVGVVTVEPGEDVTDTIRTIANDPQVYIIFITEPVYQSSADVIDRFRGQATPAITLIPSVVGNQEIAATQLRDAVRIAIGSEIV